jgi:hypothetical protein
MITLLTTIFGFTFLGAAGALLFLLVKALLKFAKKDK